MNADAGTKPAVLHMNTLPVKLSDQELEDLFDCARERHVDPFELMRRVILEELVR